MEQEKEKRIPRGFRNNNPLNIRLGMSRWEGRASVQSDPDFVVFRTMAFGYRAAWKLLESYRLRFYRQGKTFCLGNIIYRWAPPSDGNETMAYLYTVLHLLKNVGGREPIPPVTIAEGAARIARILAAMTCIENGIRWDEVDREAILAGFSLAYPQVDVPQVVW